MAILVSPGVSISVIDESAYGGAGPGTVPLIFIATASNKTQPSDAGIAEGTLPENAGKLWLITSQRELVQVFGNPKFYVNQGTPLHGYELNEYGLLAAYQYLGIANRAYIMRGDLDMSQLEPSLYAPRGPALSGTYWLDTSLSSWGAFVSNGNAVPGRAWRLNSPVVIDTQRETETVILGDQGYTDNTTDVITTAGTWVIDIDGTTVTWTHSGVSGDDVTLQDIVDDINNQAIPNIRAVAFRYSGLSYFQLKNTSGESISIGNSSSPALLALLGITSPATQIVQPKSSL